MSAFASLLFGWRVGKKVHILHVLRQALGKGPKRDRFPLQRSRQDIIKLNRGLALG